MELRIREVDEGGGGLTGTRTSEAKGPFPGGKRVGSWGKKKNKSKSKRESKRENIDVKSNETKKNLTHFKEMDAERDPDLPESAIRAYPSLP
ncbi:MAG: hypothetical protein RL553_2220 [Planctomycetota bacterium]|jgi:hypothetical protein